MYHNPRTSSLPPGPTGTGDSTGHVASPAPVDVEIMSLV